MRQFLETEVPTTRFTHAALDYAYISCPIGKPDADRISALWFSGLYCHRNT